MSKVYQFATAIARFASEAGISVKDACELHRLSVRAFKAGERNCNTGSDATSKAYNRATDKVKTEADKHGIQVQWPGLWPVFILPNGRQEMLPGSN
jgi:hypothetical protein